MSKRAAQSPRTLDTDLQQQFAHTIRGLSMDAVEAAKSGHPGMPMGSAEMATVLWTEFLVHDPGAPTWADRDRFVLSAGHGSMLIYSLLHLTGYELPLDELRNFRQWGSKTAGHPEYGHTPGVEITTGPLGTGLASSVGFALAERFLADRYNRGGHTVVDHFTYGIAGDGCLMEGVASEAASLAGHLGLGKLIYLWDDNHVSIDGSTEISFTEDVRKRFESYGWQVIDADGHDMASVRQALLAARDEADKPSLICCRTVIGKGSPNKAGTSAVHGAALGEAEVAASKQAMGWPEEPFHVPTAVTEAMAAAQVTHKASREAWETEFAAYAAAEPELAAEFELLQRGELPAGVFDGLPRFETGDKIATRKASGKVLAALCAAHPTLLGGSADLAGSNCVEIPDSPDQSRAAPGGRNIRFGVREHAMAAICNGIALHGGARCFDATFLVFSDFMRGGLRLSALMGLPVVHVFTHDSFYLGEDGPTHQPIEHAMSLRAIPGLEVIRPADGRETLGAWKSALSRRDGPTALLLTRQNLPVLANSRDDISQGAYVVHEPAGEAEGILLATGSEVSLAIEAAALLESRGKPVRVVSMPSWEAFEAQDESYRAEVLPSSLSRRLAIEAGTTLGWHRYASAVIGIDHFGASAPAKVLAEKFGFTPEAVAARYSELS
jgi:transketolase